jgi:hypothetical protein
VTALREHARRACPTDDTRERWGRASPARGVILRARSARRIPARCRYGEILRSPRPARTPGLAQDDIGGRTSRAPRDRTLAAAAFPPTPVRAIIVRNQSAGGGTPCDR